MDSQQADRLRGLSINLATVRMQWDLRQAVENCLRLGITAIAPWRDQVEVIGLDAAALLVREHDVRVTDLCRGGMFTAPDQAGRNEAIAENRRAIDQAVALRAAALVLVVGGLPAGSRNLADARKMVRDGIAEVLPYARAHGVPLAIEPLHPMYAPDRACVNTLEQALDLCAELGDGVGVAIDTYHCWWDPKFLDQIARAGRENRILAHHICDWLVPTRDLLMDRGMMGDGVIDFLPIRRAIEAAGYHGPQAVEIFSTENWGKKPGKEVLRTCIERYLTLCVA
jgi:sugar phosphate isomerase/epimerase